MEVVMSLVRTAGHPGLEVERLEIVRRVAEEAGQRDVLRAVAILPGLVVGEALQEADQAAPAPLRDAREADHRPAVVLLQPALVVAPEGRDLIGWVGDGCLR